MECARHPTNPVAQSDPEYSSRTVGMLQSAYSELNQVGSARFLNQMDEVGSGINAASAALSILLKAGFIWNDETLKEYTENTIMREARLAVVSCGEKTDTLPGSVDKLYTCVENTSTGTITTTIHDVTTLEWLWDPVSRTYISKGSYEHERVEVRKAEGTCTRREAIKGRVDGSGRLVLIKEPAAVAVLGYDYSAGGFVDAEVPWTSDCGTATSGSVPEQITWLPDVQGIANGGVMAGNRDTPSCVGNDAKGTEVVKWNFVAPPSE